MIHIIFNYSEEITDLKQHSYLIMAMKELENKNGLGDYSYDKVWVLDQEFKGHKGTHEHHTIIKNGIKLGYLETFINTERIYYEIYTSPL